MSFWGAQVIVSLFGAIPWIGPGLVEWIQGDFLPSDATLNRFFALHVIAMPLAILLLVVLHLAALHEVGSNNPDGVDIKKKKDAAGKPLDGIPFHPYYTVKDMFGAGALLILFAAVIFFEPTFGGLFLEHDNFVEANPLVTPAHIKPVWYFTPYYAMLRAVPDKLLGVVVMGAAVMIMFLLPWLDRSPVRSIRYRGPLTKAAVAIFVVAFVGLAWLGSNPGSTVQTLMAQILTVVYFLFFLAMPFYTAIDKVQPVPERVTMHD
jgi:ubiquinol-cytochrome c reductase cytochrome b subunit